MVNASRFETAMYCKEFCSVYSIAGIASFQLSPVNIALERLVKRTVAGADWGCLLESSYRAMVKLEHSLMISVRKTAVDGK